MGKNTIREAISAAPPVSATGLTLLGYALSDWLLILTFVYTVFLLIDKFPVVVTRMESLVAWVKGKVTDGKERS
jgi:hypothetical protein